MAYANLTKTRAARGADFISRTTLLTKMGDWEPIPKGPSQVVCKEKIINLPQPSERRSLCMLHHVTPSVITDCRVGYLYEEFVVEIVANRASRSNPLPIASEFNPSDELAKFLVHGNAEERLTIAEAKEQLARFVRSFIGTIADSLRSRQGSHIQLTENGQFRENVARSLLHRFSVGLYEQINFLNALLKEITPVAASSQFGSASGVLTKVGDELVVKSTGHKAPPLFIDPQWVKASIPRN